MKISIITVSYNSVATIEETIKSVINQTYSNIEYIVIDGASNDGTVDIINKYRYNIAYFVSESDKGMYFAMNKGLKVATGDYVFILNSDDILFDENVIEKIITKLNNHCDILIGNLKMIEQDGKEIDVKNDEIDKMHMYFIGIYQQAIFYRCECFKKYGYFSEDYKLASDIAWLYDRLFIEKRKLEIYYVNQYFSKFKLGGRSNNTAFRDLNIKERTILVQKYLNPFQMKIYELYKCKAYPFMHKYFRSLARNPKIAEPVNKFVRGLLRFVFGWKINMRRDAL